MGLVSALDGNNPIALPDCPDFGVRIPFDGEYLQTQAFRNPQYTSFGLFYHRGVDLIRRDGTIAGAPLKAAAGGQVVNINDIHYTYGNHVRIYHGLHTDEGGTVRAIYSLYAHMTPSIAVNVGDIVQQGDVIGWADNSGLSTGSHLHWEVRYSDIRVSPLAFVRVIPPPPPPPPPPSDLEVWFMALDQATQDALLRVAQNEKDIVYLGDKGLLLAMYERYGTENTEGRNKIKRRVGELFDAMGDRVMEEPANVVQRLVKTLSLPGGGSPTDAEGLGAPEDDGQDE